MGIIYKNGISYGGGSGGGGLLPHLIIISETGESVVKAVKGTTEIIATETSTGHYECDVPEFGTWTIHAVLNGEDATVNLVVDTVKVYTVDDSHFYATVTVKYPTGATCRLQSADETLYATGSPYTFTVHHKETYTITVTYSQRIYTDTVTFTTEGQSFSKTLPSPSEVDANDINWWLFFGGVSGTFSTLADILGNSTALSTLMASTDAVDYLVRCTNWISDICGDQSAMSYIGLNDYCANTLLADEDWNNGIVNSSYSDSVLTAQIPIMTSNTTPSGVASASTEYAGFGAYKAFDGVASGSFWITASSTNHWVQYEFPNPIIVCKMFIQNSNGAGNNPYYVGSFTLQASNDGNTWETLTSGTMSPSSLTTATKKFSNTTKYKYYRLYVSRSASGNYYMTLGILQLYGREDV